MNFEILVELCSECQANVLEMCYMSVVDFINALFFGVLIVITSFGDVLIWSVML